MTRITPRRDAIDWGPLNRVLLKMVDHNVGQTQIAFELGVSLGALQRYAALCGLPLPERGRT